MSRPSRAMAFSLACLVSSGCLYPGHSGVHTAAYVVDGLLVAGGTFLVVGTHGCEVGMGPPGDESCLASDLIGVFGGAVLAAGVLGGLLNLGVQTPDDPAAPAPSAGHDEGASHTLGIRRDAPSVPPTLM